MSKPGFDYLLLNPVTVKGEVLNTAREHECFLGKFLVKLREQYFFVCVFLLLATALHSHFQAPACQNKHAYSYFVPVNS